MVGGGAGPAGHDDQMKRRAGRPRLRRNRLTTDALREVKNTFSRFLSILILSGLAVAFLAGLRTTAPDMQYTADGYYDRTNLMDGYVISTLGLTDEDLDVLSAQAGIEDTEGIWSVDAIAQDAIVSVRSMPRRLNLLETVEGRLPEKADECVTERLLLIELGLDVGDRLELVLDEDNEGDLENLSYTITGVVNSPLYVGTDRGTSSLGGGSVDGFVYIPEENFNYDYYTMAYFTGEGFRELDSYGDEYDERLDALLDSLDGLADERARLRYASVVGDAQEEIDDAQAELDDAREELADAQSDADQELADAQQELLDARQELDDGWNDYQEGLDTYDQEIRDAEKELADAHRELLDAEQELADGKQQYADGMKEYQDGLAEYEDGVRDYEDGRKKYEDGLKEYEDGKSEYENGLAAYEDGRREYADGLALYEQKLAEFQQNEELLNQQKTQLENGLAAADAGLKTLDDAQKRVDDGIAVIDERLRENEAARNQLDPGAPQYEEQIERLNSVATALNAQRSDLETQKSALQEQRAGVEKSKSDLQGQQVLLNMGFAMLEDGRVQLEASAAQLKSAQSQLSSAQSEIEAARSQLADARRELDDGKAELDDAEKELADGRTELDDAWKELEDARVEIEDGERELADGWDEYRDGERELHDSHIDGAAELNDAAEELTNGEEEYAEGLTEYENGRREADEKIADAQQKLDDAQAELDDARAELADIDECEWYVLGRDTNAGFEGYGQDSERIGNLANIFPVIFFLVAALACLTTMTRMVEEQRTQIGALKAMGFSRLSISRKYIGYALAASLIGGVLGLMLGGTLMFKNQIATYVISVLAAVFCTTGAALWACLSTLVDTPANLMRPRAPKPGKRVFLEYIRPLWSRLSFTWKVTMRNLFRYQRRFWMTVIGIGGCTALIVTGFGLHDSIFSILNRQFDELSLYDATVGLDPDADPDARAVVENYLTASGSVEEYLISSQSMAEASTDGPAYDVFLFAVKDMEEFTRFIDLRHRLDSEPVALPDDGVIITEKLSELLDVRAGDVITLEKDDTRVTAVVSDIVENYVRHYVYLSDGVYERLFGEAPEENVALIRYNSGSGETQSERVSVDLMEMEAVTSYSYIATIRDSFTDSMVAIDYAVVIIIVAAAALAFVVLYNLTNINITERTRELATLKVLGFYDRETTAYVYRENIFLTIFGILLGLVMGRLLHSWLVLTVEVNIVMFGRTAPPYAYVLAAVLTVVFSVVVNIAAHFKLKKVDMVESLKTVE